MRVSAKAAMNEIAVPTVTETSAIRIVLPYICSSGSEVIART